MKWFRFTTPRRDFFTQLCSYTFDSNLFTNGIEQNTLDLNKGMDWHYFLCRKLYCTRDCYTTHTPLAYVQMTIACKTNLPVHWITVRLRLWWSLISPALLSPSYILLSIDSPFTAAIDHSNSSIGWRSMDTSPRTVCFEEGASGHCGWLWHMTLQQIFIEVHKAEGQ